MLKKVLKIGVSAIIFIVVVTVLSKLWKGAQASKRLKAEILSIKPELEFNKITDLISLRSFPIVTRIGINNFSNETFTLNQIYVEAYTPEGEFLANQTMPIPSNVELGPNTTTAIDIKLELNSRNSINFIKEGKRLSDFLRLVAGGELGKQVRIKGFIVAEGLKAPIDELVNV
ncbi:MAG: hypothetical protein ACPGJS_20075 [Flammeovirgaceae bacterium]